jgi:tetratricopeptide (TPR) repeat protein
LTNIAKAFEQGDFLQVVEAAGEARSPEEELMVGVSLFKVGRETEAVEVLTRVSRRAAELARAYYHLAVVHQGRGEIDQARSCLELYLAFYPDDDEALDLLQDEGDMEPMVDEASPMLARLYANQGHYRQALEIYARILSGPDTTPELEREARKVEAMHVVKTLEGWLERARRW